ncbi:PA14 domain-containing protein [Dactylosporangium sp. CA-139114]|uniref:PA14 domain-containing protein n=1 Tax=Dactylosporangium sp. CA-139114 TaxID=3239931 RepID=UPI003D977FC5
MMVKSRRRRHAVVRAVALVVAVLAATVAVSVPAEPLRAAPPAGFQTSLVAGSGLDGPSGFEIAPDGRIFILERTGKIKIFKNGQLLAQPFAELPSVGSGDRGLIGVAFDPGFGVDNFYVYFYYTGLDLLNRLVRFDASTDVGTQGPFLVFQTQSPSQELHVGGSIRFGPDGKLYFAVGDNGYPPNAQDLSNPHGKILRINKDGSIPADNPFYGQPGKLGAIWAYGFRNPWRFQFDRATGELYGGDVGDFSWEEVNHIVKGGNYGWPLHEGACTSNCAGFTDPIYTYAHDGQSAAVTGGPVYRGTMFPPEYRGSLFFGDYAKGFIKRADLDGAGKVTAVHDFDAAAGAVVDLKEAPDGSLYYLTYFPGRLYRIGYDTGNQQPTANAGADVVKGTNPLTVHFSSAGSSDPDGDPLTYQWSFGDGTSSGEANPTKVFDTVGVYQVSLTVSDGQGHSSTAVPLVVQVGVPPTLRVAVPADGSTYRAGDTITYNAFANDAAGFDLNDASIKTEVRLHHGTHFHPFLGPLTGRVGSFTIPRTGEPSADTWYEILVTATDTNGLSDTKSVRINPLKSTLTFQTSPPGLGLDLDGIPITTPYIVQGVRGFQRELAAQPLVQAADGTVYHFVSWSDGKTVRHVITTPDADTTYTANYAPSGTFAAQYFSNTTLTGTPALTRQDPLIDFVWPDEPGPGVTPDQFSARWTKSQYFAAGRYKFTTVTDDGVRLFIDDKLVIDEWHDQAGTAHDYSADLTAGDHAIRMEFYDGGAAAVAKLFWDSTPDQPNQAWAAQYWNTPGTGSSPTIPSGPAALSRSEDDLSHDWAAGSPDPAIAPDHFAARWKRTVLLEPGVYTFTATADDGVRLSVDGVRVIDQWTDHPPTEFRAQVTLDGGPHDVVLDYYENAGDARIRLVYAKVGDPPDPASYTAQFWNSTTPAIPDRAADLTRTDRTIAFDWGAGSPGAPINADNFVARWTKTDTLADGVYRFSGVSDDGIRVYVDNTLILDRWQDQNAPYSVDKVLLGGTHTIRVEYYEHEVGAQVSFAYTRIGAVTPDDPWHAEYFANPTLSGVAAVTRLDDVLDFDWGTGSPDPAIPADQFSARWTKTTRTAAGTYEFTVVSDDGARLYVDGALVLDRWVDQGPQPHTVTLALAEGTHTIVLEYYEAFVGAVARLSYRQTDGPATPPAQFKGEYFANPTLSGTPALTRNDDVVAFNWGEGSPAPGIPVDGFSARWTKTESLAAGTYRLTVTADDGIRVLVDGAVKINGWVDQSPTTYTADVTLTAGQHTIVIEYYEAFVTASVSYRQTRL